MVRTVTAKMRRRTHSTVYVARDDREELGRRLNLGNDPSETWLWRFTDHLLFGTAADKDSGALLIDHRTLGVLAERSHRSGKHSAYDLIMEYQQRTGVKLGVALPNALLGKARAVESMEFPPGVAEVSDRMRRTRLPLDQRVALDTGEPWRPTVGRAHRLATREEALKQCAEVGNPDAVRLLELLNHAPSNRWAKVGEFTNDLRSAAEELPPESQEYALNIIAKIEIQPMPFFAPVDRSARIYSVGPTVLALPRELRKEMVRLLGWRSLDLKSAQLAIVARLWEVESLREFLSTGVSFWDHVLRHLNLGNDAKPTIKNALYALIFGESERKSKARFLAAFPSGEELWKAWRSHPLISDLYRARRRVMVAYRKAGGALDAYGKWWPVQRVDARDESGRPYSSTDVRSVMATVAQSYELKLLSPVLDVLSAASRFVQLMYWLHDGFAISVPPSRASVIRDMQAAVSGEAARLGIQTELVEE